MAPVKNFRRLFSAKRSAILAGLLGMMCFSSCSPTVVRALTPEALQQRGLKPGEGLIVGRFEKRAFDRSGKPAPDRVTHSVLRSKGKGERKQMMPVVDGKRYSNETQPMFALGGGEAGDTFAIPVPAGQYEIDSWSMLAQGYGATVGAASAAPLHVPFEVREGEATYLGDVKVLSINGKNLIGMPVFGEGMVFVTEPKDIGSVARHYPMVRRMKVRRSDVPKQYVEALKRIAERPRPWWAF